VILRVIKVFSFHEEVLKQSMNVLFKILFLIIRKALDLISKNLKCLPHKTEIQLFVKNHFQHPHQTCKVCCIKRCTILCSRKLSEIYKFYFVVYGD